MAQFVKPDGVEAVEVQATEAECAAIDEAKRALDAQKVVEAEARATAQNAHDEAVSEAWSALKAQKAVEAEARATAQQKHDEAVNEAWAALKAQKSRVVVEEDEDKMATESAKTASLQARYEELRDTPVPEPTSEIAKTASLQAAHQELSDTSVPEPTAEIAVTAELETRLAQAKAAAIHPDKTRIKPYALDYNSIFTHMIAAIKELDQIVQKQAVEIENLKTR